MKFYNFSSYVLKYHLLHFCAENPAKIWCGNWSKSQHSDSHKSAKMKIKEWKLCRPYVLQCYRHFKQLQRMQSLKQPIVETLEKPYKWKHCKKAPSCDIWKHTVEQSHTNFIGFASFWADSLGTPLKKMTGGTPEVRSDKSLTFGPMDQWSNELIEWLTNGPMDQWSHGPIVQWS